MRRLLLLTALCMAMALVFAPAALAQDVDCPQLSEAEEQAVFAADPSDSNRLDENDNGVPCEDDMTDDGSFTLPAEETTMMEEATMMEPTSVEPTMMEETAMMEPTTVTAGQYDTTATPSPLPDTGGPSAAAFALPSLVLLVAGGIFAARLVRK